MYRSISDNDNSWDESTKEEADGGEADEGSVSSQRLWKAGTGCLQQTACSSPDLVELFSDRDEPHQTPKNNGQEDSANSEGLMGDSSDCLDSDSLEIPPNEDFARNEEETEHIQCHPQPKLYPVSQPPLHRLSNQPLGGLSAAFETWTHDDDNDDDDDDDKEMVNETIQTNHTTTTTMSDKGKPKAAHYDNEAKTTTTTTITSSEELRSAEKFREGDEITPIRRLDTVDSSSSLLRCKEIERKRTERPNRNNLLQQIRRIPSKVYSKIRRKDEDKIQMQELRINKELGLHLTLAEKANNTTMTSPDYGKSHRNGCEGGGRTMEWDAEDCDFENRTLRNQANSLNSNPLLGPKSRWKTGTRGPNDCHSPCSSFSNCSVVKTLDSFPQRNREPIDKCADSAESTKTVFSRILRCPKQQQQPRLDGCNSSRDSCDALASVGDPKSELRDDFKVKKSILDEKRRVHARRLPSPCILRRRKSSSSSSIGSGRGRDATCTAEPRSLDAGCRDDDDVCPSGSTMIQTVLTDADGSPNVRMVGEIAAQLERRILLYVFSGTDRKSDYGIQVRNIPEAIEETCLDRNTGKVNVSLRFRLIKRCAFVETSVRPFGYRFDFHPQFAVVLLSKYGRVDHSTLKPKFFVSPVDAEARRDVIRLIDCACPPSERDHVIVLFNCLLLLSSDDGKSVFIWND